LAQCRKRLTLPSSGHPTAGGDCSLRHHRRRRCVPLTSNVRALSEMQSESSSHSPWKARSAAIGPRPAWAVRPSAASEPTAVLDYVVRCHWLGPRTSSPNALCFADKEQNTLVCPAAKRSVKRGHKEECVTRESLLMPASLVTSVFTAMASPGVAAIQAAGRRPPLASVWRAGKRSVVFFNQRPNPSVERTHNGGSRLLAPSTSEAPLRAAHVKR
jgi:hypothetical protein